MDSFLLLRRLVAAIVFKGQTVSDYWWSRRTIFLTLRDGCLSLPPYCVRTETLSPSLQLSPRFANGIHPPCPFADNRKRFMREETMESSARRIDLGR